MKILYLKKILLLNNSDDKIDIIIIIPKTKMVFFLSNIEL